MSGHEDATGKRNIWIRRDVFATEEITFPFNDWPSGD